MSSLVSESSETAASPAANATERAEPPSEEVIAQANRLKDEGNQLLSNGRFAQAAAKYTQAIALHKTAIFLSNRAQALIKLEAYGEAINDANEALAIDPKYIKAYYRRGSANYALGKLKAALKDFKTVLTIVPKDPDAQNKAKVCEKLIREEAFLKAIEVEEGERGGEPSLDVSYESIAVESSYTGPRLDGDDTPITVEFVRECMEHFRLERKLHKRYVVQILQRAIAHFKSLPTLLRLSLPSTASSTSSSSGRFIVCGDTHGQYYDLLNLFEITGAPSEHQFFLFNGDYVDRGSFSFETVFTLLLWKLALPESLFMLRGNHETKNMNKIYGFEGEVKFKYDDSVMKLFSVFFQSLPLAAVLQDKVFVVHGGISTENGGKVSLSEIESVVRFREPPESGLMSDLLWSDPQAQRGRSPSKRGLGFSFGPDYTAQFLAHNSLSLLVRSHEVREEGYEIEHDGKCITVFSAPNYCDQMGNKGAYLVFTDEQSLQRPECVSFTHVPHPNVPPMRYAMNLFSL